MRITCPHCHAEELRCPEVLPACRAAGIERRRLYAAANGNAEAVLRSHDGAWEWFSALIGLPPTPPAKRAKPDDTAR